MIAKCCKLCSFGIWSLVELNRKMNLLIRCCALMGIILVNSEFSLSLPLVTEQNIRKLFVLISKITKEY